MRISGWLVCLGMALQTSCSSSNNSGAGGAGMGTGGTSPGTGGTSVGTGGSSPGTGGAPAGTGGASAGTGGTSAGSGGAAGGGGLPYTMLPEIPGPIDDTVITTPANGLRLSSSTNARFAVGPDGSVVVLDARNLIKYDPTITTPIWTTPFPPLNAGVGRIDPLDIAIDSQGNTYVTGSETVSTAPFTLNPDLTKYSPAGVLVWDEVLPAANVSFNNIMVTSNDQIVVTGSGAGQLPNQPAAARGGGFVVRYDVAGNLLSSFQSTAAPYNRGARMFGLGNGPNNEAIINFAEILGLVDTAGALIWASTTVIDLDMTSSPDGSIIASTTPYLSMNARTFVRFSPITGAVTTAQTLGKRTVVLNAAEGSMWQGNFYSPSRMVATRDAVYMSGIYMNTYINGSNPKPNNTVTYLVKIDAATGNQVWAHLYGAPSTNTYIQTPFIELGLGVSGQLIANVDGRLLLRLSTVDGSFL